MGTKRDILDLYITPDSYELIEMIDAPTNDTAEQKDDWDALYDFAPRKEELFIALNNREEVTRECEKEVLSILLRRAATDSTPEIRASIAVAMRSDIDRNISATLAQIATQNSSLLLNCHATKCRFRIAGDDNKRLLTVAFRTELPAGELLSDALPKYDGAELFRTQEAIYALVEELIKNKISFKRLTTADIIVGEDGLLYPFQYHNIIPCKDVRFDIEPTHQETLCEALCKEIERYSEEYMAEECRREGVEFMCVDYKPLPLGSYGTRFDDSFPGHIWHGYPHEERVLVQDELGYGFVNLANEFVVAPNYIWAESFCEGRALVRSDRGYGAIDTSGNEVIPAIYDGICFYMNSGTTFVKKGDKWGQYNYNGELITSFEIDYPTIDAVIYEVD